MAEEKPEQKQEVPYPLGEIDTTEKPAPVEQPSPAKPASFKKGLSSAAVLQKGSEYDVEMNVARSRSRSSSRDRNDSHDSGTSSSRRSSNASKAVPVADMEGINGFVPSPLKARNDVDDAIEEAEEAPNKYGKWDPRGFTVTGPLPEERKYTLWRDILYHLRPGITLGLVNLPLSVSLAIAAGATPEMGALSAVWGAFVGGLSSGSHFTLLAPTGGLSGVLGNYAQMYGQACLPWLSLFAAIISFITWKLKLADYLTIIPACGMAGFKLGIGVIIGLNQLNFALGLNPGAIPEWHKHEHFWQRVVESLKHAPKHTKPWNPVLFFACCIPLFLLVKYAPPKIRTLPWHIFFVAVGVVLGYFVDQSGNKPQFLLLQDRFTINPYLIGTSNTTAFFAGVQTMNWGGVVSGSLSVALIAILETQIAAKILQAHTQTQFDASREVLATALANAATGLAGGVPICGAMARMTLNANCGARTRVSILINAVTVFILLFGLLPLFKYLPQPVIGAVLVPVAMSMIKIDVYRRYWREDKAGLVICMLTFVVCVFVDPTYAIVVAMLLGALREAKKFKVLVPATTSAADGALVYAPIGHWTYTNCAAHLDAVDKFCKAQGKRGVASLTLDFAAVAVVDIDGVDAVGKLMATDALGTEVRVTLDHVAPAVRDVIAHYPWFVTAEADGRVLSAELKMHGANVSHA